MRIAVQSISLYLPILVKICIFYDKIILHLDSFTHPQQKAA
jgi:hypothetical protein